MKKILISTLALALLISCEETALVPENNYSANEIFASTEAFNATKTTLDGNNNVVWSNGDQVIAFTKTNRASKYQIQEKYVGNTAGAFSLILGPNSSSNFVPEQELSHNIMLYPYSSEVRCNINDSNSLSYKLNVTLPEVQSYTENSFSNGAFPMVAVSESSNLTFKNVCGGLKIQLKGVDKVESIKLEGLGNEKLAGPATVVGYADGTNPTIAMGGSATASIILDCGEGVQLDETNPTTFIISVPPVTFVAGMRITVTDTEGFSRTLINSSENTIRRSSLLTFPVITYQQEGVFEIPEGAVESFEIPTDGGDVEIPIVTNQDYNVVIPAEASGWISVVDTKAVREETVILNIEPNTTSEARSAEIIIASTEGLTLQAITISQEADNTLGNKTYSLGAVVGGAYWERFLIIDNKQYEIVVPSDDRNWCSSSISYDANGNRGVYIKVYNNSGEARSTVISVTNTSDNIKYDITVNQNAASENDERYLIFTNNTLYANSWFAAITSDYQEFHEIYSNVDFDDLALSVPEDAQSWITANLSRTSTNGMYVLLLNAKLNTGAARSAIIEVLSKSNSNLTLKVRVDQSKGEPVVYSYIDANGNNLGNGIDVDGVVWAPVNVGASSETEYGNYYSWLEAHRACPAGWRLPTVSEFMLLKNIKEWAEDSEGMKFYGSNASNNYVFLPAAGNSTGSVQWGYAGFYHTSDEYTTTSGAEFTFTSTEIELLPATKESGKYSVRCVLISDEEQSNSEITINGLTWATKNLGASSISDIGNMYTKDMTDIICPCPEGWRLPTLEEYNSVKQHSVWSNVNGVNGYWVSGTNINLGESTGVFLPYGVWYYHGNDGINEKDGKAAYMTSTPYTGYVNGFYSFTFTSDEFSNQGMSGGNHYIPIRCVKGTLTPPYITASKSSIQLAYNSTESQIIKFSSNVSGFSLEVPDESSSWLNATLSGNNVVISASENNGYPRSATIRIIAHNHINTSTEIQINQEGVVEFNDNNCIYYKANRTADTSGDNYYCKRSYFYIGYVGDCYKMEMKFKLNTISSGYAYLASYGNQEKDSSTAFQVTTSGITLGSCTWAWTDLGISYTDLITLTFSGEDESILINNKKLNCPGITNLAWTYLFSSYYRDSDDGVYEEYDAVPDGSELYYVKMYDNNDNLIYHGHAAQNKINNQYCWCSNKQGIIEYHYAHDYVNQGGFEGNF